MIVIRECLAKDLPVLRSLFLQGRQALQRSPHASSFTLLDFDKETEGEYILVALADDTLIAFISVWLADNFIHHLYVDSNHHDNGVGTRLLKAILDKTGFPVRLKCLENNTRAVAFYNRKGFIEKGSGESTDGRFIVFELSNAVV